MGLCANMKYTLVDTFFLWQQTDGELIWKIFCLLPRQITSAACSATATAVHCRTSQMGSPRGLPLLWVREDESTQVSLLRVVEDHCTQGHGGRIVSMRICYNPNEFELNQGFTSVLRGVSEGSTSIVDQGG